MPYLGAVGDGQVEGSSVSWRSMHKRLHGFQAGDELWDAGCVRVLKGSAANEEDMTTIHCVSESRYTSGSQVEHFNGNVIVVVLLFVRVFMVRILSSYIHI